MNQPHRYSGPELSALLEQVRRELGAEANIVEANKLRSGGVAGFFASEKFEVVAFAPEHDAERTGATAGDVIELNRSHDDRASRGPSEGRQGMATALLERAEAISIQERIELSRPRVQKPQVLVADRPIAPFGSKARADDLVIGAPLRAPSTEVVEAPSWFDDVVVSVDELAQFSVLEQTDTEVVSKAEFGSEARAETPSHAESRPEKHFGSILAAELSLPEILLDGRYTPPSEPAQASVEQTPAVEVRRPPAARDILASELEPTSLTVSSSSTDRFWEQVDSFERAFVERDLESSIVTVVGNMSAALSVARTLESQDVGVPTALVLMTANPEKADLPAWQVHQTGGELGYRLRYWTESQRKGIVVIDADLGPQAKVHVERARQAGSRVVRLAIDDEMSPKRIFTLLQHLGGNVVVDLTFRADPAYLLNLLERGVPVTSVEGRRVDSRLMFAIAGARDRG